MEKLALYVKLEAKPGKEKAVENFLKSGLQMAEHETATISWYALRISPTVFAIYDTFQDENGRNAHLAGKLASALKEKANELFAKPPVIEKVDIVAAKMPQHEMM